MVCLMFVESRGIVYLKQGGMFYESCRDVDKKRMNERPGHLCNRNSNNFIFTENIFNFYL
ncbi:TPA: hypothetical protein HMJ82_08210 [Escherichia coli]|nr:hypothetical protein [Escherichia coli]